MVPLSFLCQPSSRRIFRICILPFCIRRFRIAISSMFRVSSSARVIFSVSMERRWATVWAMKVISSVFLFFSSVKRPISRGASSPRRLATTPSSRAYFDFRRAMVCFVSLLSSARNLAPSSAAKIVWFSQNSSSKSSRVPKEPDSTVPSCQVMSASSPRSASRVSHFICTRPWNQHCISGICA